MRRVVPLILLLLLILFKGGVFAASPEEIRIGVLSFRDPEQTRSQWSPTADYLSQAIPEYHFTMVPMNYPTIEKAVADKSIDFILTNTAHYVTLEAKHGITRMLTLVVSVDNTPFKEFGGVIFTRQDRTDINTLGDLRGKRFLAVGQNSLGGYLVAWQTLLRNGVNPAEDFKELLFNGLPHDGVVRRVLAGEVDAGTVRTHVLENMAGEGKIDLGEIKVLNQRKVEDFPYILSTELYPEWPLSRLQHTDEAVIEKLIVALLTMPAANQAKLAGKYDRWAPPLNYQGVHDLFKELRTGPYADFKTFTLADVIQKYQKEIIFLCLLLICVLLFIVKIIHLNDSLKTALSEVKTLQGFLPICASCKKIRDDSGYWNRIETYIRNHSEAEFSHSICPSCAQKLMDEFEEQHAPEKPDPTC